jgi:3-hydroxyisobutyrate dehydrogenase/glyoxylate/succinic semialdehyde reductase
MGHAMAGFAEGLALGRAMGIEKGLVLDTLLSTPAVAPVVAGKRRKIEEEDFSPEFPLQWMHKDLQLAILTAFELDLPMPATHAVKEVFSSAKSKGLGELDISAVTLG